MEFAERRRAVFGVQPMHLLGQLRHAFRQPQVLDSETFTVIEKRKSDGVPVQREPMAVSGVVSESSVKTPCAKTAKDLAGVRNRASSEPNRSWAA